MPTFTGNIKSAKLKSDTETGEPQLEIKLSLGVPDSNNIRDLVKHWYQHESQIECELRELQTEMNLNDHRDRDPEGDKPTASVG